MVKKKKKDTEQEKEVHLYYSRKMPLKNIIGDSSEDRDVYEKIIFRTNEVVRHTYHFLRMYVLYLFQENLEIPKITREFIKVVYSLVSERKPNANLTQELLDFYNTHYAPLQPDKPEGAKLKDVLNSEQTNIVTALENHIKMHFYNSVRRLATCYSDDKPTRRRIVDMFWKNEVLEEFEDNEEMVGFREIIFEAATNVYSKPQLAIPALLHINRTLQMYGKKTFAIIPLRKSYTPKYITLSRTNLMSSFTTKERGDTEWFDIVQTVNDLVKIKKGYHFYSMKTDGIGCSLCFQSDEKNLVTESSEKYLEDLSSYEKLLDKKIVAIDPNKGNLMYCYDGKEVLRYTHVQRRHETKKTKYKHIRQKEEKNYLVQLECDNDFMSVKENNQILSQYNSRTTWFEEFKDYVREKNLACLRFGELYQESIFRKLDFNTKINTDRCEDKFLSKFQKKFGDPKDVVVVFGDWEQRQGISYGKEPTKGKGCRKLLRKAGYEVLLKDEFRTSKLCCECHSENEKEFVTRMDPRPWMENRIQKVWGLLRCTNVNCRKVHNRDMNSVKNIYFLGTCIIQSMDIPDVFKR